MARGEKRQRATTKYGSVLTVVVLGTSLSLGPSHRPPRGADTAINVAEAVLVPVYGKEKIESERPFTAKLKGEVWTATGTLHCPDGEGGTTTSCVGGVAIVEIPKLDGRILSMVHGK